MARVPVILLVWEKRGDMEEIIFIQSFIHPCLLSTLYIGRVSNYENIQRHASSSHLKEFKVLRTGEQSNMFIKINITKYENKNRG